MEKRILVCDNCNKKFVGNITRCPICKGELRDGGPVPEKHHLNNAPVKHPAEKSVNSGAHFKDNKPKEEQNHVHQHRSVAIDPTRGRTQSFVLRIIAVSLVLVMLVLAVISGKTSVFKENDGDKTVLFSSMKSNVKDSFCEYINKFSPLFEEGYASSCTTFETLLDKIEPSNPDGLYAAFYEKEEVRTDGADPVGRFAISPTLSGYTMVEKEKISAIVESIGLTALEDINTKSMYCYDGVYYFAEGSAKNEGKKYAVVTSTKQTSKGDYYCECDIYSSADALVDTDGLTPDYTRFVLVNAKENEDGSIKWKLKQISPEPLYEKSGARIEKTDSEDNILSYKIKRKTMTAKTESGVVFANYYIEYPVFDNSGIAQAACESVYTDKLEEFKTKIGNADNLYAAFKDDGGKDEMLPLYTNVVVSVKYNEDGCFSILEKVSDYNPIEPPKTSNASPTQRYNSSSEEENVLDEQEILKKKNFCESVYEGITFKTDTGDFLKKDQLLGTDYNVIIDKLYSIYSNSGESTPFNEAEISSDNAYLGSKIYNSAWTLSDDGMNFYYTGDNGLEIVTVPWENLNTDVLK